MKHHLKFVLFFFFLFFIGTNLGYARSSADALKLIQRQHLKCSSVNELSDHFSEFGLEIKETNGCYVGYCRGWYKAGIRDLDFVYKIDGVFDGTLNGESEEELFLKVGIQELGRLVILADDEDTSTFYVKGLFGLEKIILNCASLSE